MRPRSPLTPIFAPSTATLELKTSKENADPSVIGSVQFSPDGSKIVSGGFSGTIKVWDAGEPFELLP